jgi:hypothetical protein
MTYEQLLDFYQTQTGIARAFGIAPASVAEWKERGVPPLRQLQAERLTKKKLRAEPNVFSRNTQS